jgi:hypothetical protein
MPKSWPYALIRPWWRALAWATRGHLLPMPRDPVEWKHLAWREEALTTALAQYRNYCRALSRSALALPLLPRPDAAHSGTEEELRGFLDHRPHSLVIAQLRRAVAERVAGPPSTLAIDVDLPKLIDCRVMPVEGKVKGTHRLDAQILVRFEGRQVRRRVRRAQTTS